jgi:hypothetical protein
VETLNPKTISRLPASRFPNPAEVYFCDNCGRDLTNNLHHDRSPVWQPLRPIWYVCQCGRQYLSGAAEWDNLTTWERKQRIRQLGIGSVLFAFLMISGTLAYFASYGSAALLAAVAITLIPSILVARLLGFVLLDVFEIIASIWRTRVSGRGASEQSTSRDAEVDQKEAQATQPLTAAPAIEHTATQMQKFPGDDKSPPGPAGNHWFLHKLPLSPVAAVIAVLIIATRWISYDLRPTSPVGASSSPQRSNAVPQENLFAPAKRPLSLMEQAAATETAMPKVSRPAFRRVQVGPNEIDDIAEDVTIRHFTPTLAPTRVHRRYKEVQIGADVTIRYFASNQAVVPRTRPESVDRSLPLSK